MVDRKNGAVVRQLDALFKLGVVRDLTDGQLLERFSTGPRDVAELAFEELVERHGAMVLRVCRAELADADDTQDAVQATFLILVKKARSLWVRDSLGPWLHQVAFRTASCARSDAARRRRHEHRAAELAPVVAPEERGAPEDWERLLHEEIDRLPERYRVPIVLCDLQGQSCEEAARRMGRPVGTVKCWRSRGRETLRDRLIRRGLSPSAALGVVPIPDLAFSPASRGQGHLAAHALSKIAAGEVPAPVQMLVKGVLKTMLLGKLQATAATVFAPIFLTAAFGTFAWVAAEGPPGPAEPSPVKAIPPIPKPPALAESPQATSIPPGKSSEIWPLTLPQAMSIGLDNSEKIHLHMLASVSPLQVSPVHVDDDPQEFRAETMAMVRSIEQQYWSLARVHVQHWAAEKAAELGREILKREQAGLASGKGTIADVAEAEQRLEQFNLDLITRTSDLITTERQLRNVLGLPPSDNRRIIPVTPPTGAELKPDWDVSLAAMVANHPDVLRAKARVKEVETSKEGSDAGRAALLQSRKDALQQVLHRTTHALARSFLEIDANYKQFQKAIKLREAAATRLQTQRAYYEEGRITLDRMMDAVGQYCSAVAGEAQFKSTYNVSICALEEAKGTLLEYDKIRVVDGPQRPYDAAYKPRPAAVSVVTTPIQSPPAPAAAPPQAPLPTKQAGAKVPPPAAEPQAGKTVAFDLTFGFGPTPVQIRGNFTITPAPAPGLP